MTTTAMQTASTSVAPLHANKRTDKDFHKAFRHTNNVGLLKKILPILAVLLTFYFILSSLVSIPEIADLSVEKIDLNDGKLVMNKPKMSGFDKNNKPYDVRAEKAIQDLSKPGLIELEKIDAQLPMDAKSIAKIEAENGTYNTNEETMVLRNNVRIKGARGMDIKMEEATINIKTGAMITNKPVSVISGKTDITADSMSVEDNGKRIVFKNRVKMTIKKPISRGVKPPATN